MNLIERITEEMNSDMSNFDQDQSDLLQEVYETADDAGKALLNRALNCLCGWELKTLLAKQDAPEDDASFLAEHDGENKTP